MTVEAMGRRSTGKQEVQFDVSLGDNYYYGVTLVGYDKGQGGYAMFSLVRDPDLLESLFGRGRKVYCGFTNSVSVKAGEERVIGTSGVVLRGS